MAKRKTTGVAPLESAVNQDNVSVPVKPVRDPTPGIGASAVRRPGYDEARVNAQQAAEQSGLFPKGGQAFVAWLKEAKGVSLRVRQPLASWQSLLTEFAARPIHGYRRGSAGGNHRRQ